MIRVEYVLAWSARTLAAESSGVWSLSPFGARLALARIVRITCLAGRTAFAVISLDKRSPGAHVDAIGHTLGPLCLRLSAHLTRLAPLGLNLIVVLVYLALDTWPVRSIAERSRLAAFRWVAG